MRSVRDITNPSIGMYIGWTVGSGENESERKYGQVKTVSQDPVTGETIFTTEPADVFRPAMGDRLFYYGIKPKGGRATRNLEQVEAREIAFKDRAAVKAQMSALRQSNRRLLIALTVTLTLLVAAMGTAALKLYGGV